MSKIEKSGKCSVNILFTSVGEKRQLKYLKSDCLWDDGQASGGFGDWASVFIINLFYTLRFLKRASFTLITLQCTDNWL